MPPTNAHTPVQVAWAKVIDHGTCIGCHACSTACKSENTVPLSVNRTYVKYVEVGAFPTTRRAFQVTRCNQCEHAPCVTACPTSAMFRREDGVVDFDKSWCIGCKACIAACPYDAIFINPSDGSAEKCNFCAHRLDIGLEPACVVVCPTQSIAVGNLLEPTSLVARAARDPSTLVRRREMGTQPRVFYRGATAATLDPLAAASPGGGIFLWSEQFLGKGHVVAGHPHRARNSAEALLAYDVPHRAPWDWRVSLYTWTKSIAAGAYAVPAALAWSGLLSADDALWLWTAPVLALVFLALTGAVLVADLTHPERFYYLFLRGQRGSWLVRGAYALAAYGLILVLHIAASVAGSPVHTVLAAAGVPAATIAAIYTAFLFRQARGRELWHGRWLPTHLALQAVLAGSASLALTGALAGTLPAPAAQALAWVMAISALAHLACIGAEVATTHPTPHATLAQWQLTRGRYRHFFLWSLALMAPVIASPWVGWPAALCALTSLLAYEHAFVQAGQSVPLS